MAEALRVVGDPPFDVGHHSSRSRRWGWAIPAIWRSKISGLSLPQPFTMCRHQTFLLGILMAFAEFRILPGFHRFFAIARNKLLPEEITGTNATFVEVAGGRWRRLQCASIVIDTARGKGGQCMHPPAPACIASCLLLRQVPMLILEADDRQLTTFRVSRTCHDLPRAPPPPSCPA